MAHIQLLLILCACASSLHASKWDGLVATWGPVGIVSKWLHQGFYDIPQTQSDAEDQGWVQVDSDSEYWTVWCLPDDGRVCVDYDLNGYVAGLESGLPYEDYATPYYDPSIHPMYRNVTRFNETITRGRFFIVPQDVLKSGGRSNMDDGVGTGLWLENGDSLMEIPLTETELANNTGFVAENCIPTMGKHFYYNMTPSLECEYMEPYFILTDAKTGDVHGLGFQSVGMPSHKDRKWYEPVPSLAIKPTVPTAPQCLVDWGAKYGVISIHWYFKKNPTSIGCNWLG